MSLTDSEPRGNGVSQADGMPRFGPQVTIGEINHPPNSPAPGRSGAAAATAPPYSDPLIYAENSSTSGESDTTYHSPFVASLKYAASNVVRLIPIPHYATRPLLHMEVVVHEPRKDFILHTLAGPQSSLTMGQVLRQYGGEIESIALDASSLPNPEGSATAAGAIELPFAPRSVTSEDCTDPPSPSMPFPLLTQLLDLSITTSRAVSIRDLLEFLHFAPLLRRLTIHNAGLHQSVIPDRVADISDLNLPYLESVTIDGLLTHGVELFLNKLIPSLKESTKVEVHLYQNGFPVLQHAPVMHRLFSKVRHARLSYTALGAEQRLDDERTDDARYLFSFTDVDMRVQLHWHWTAPRDAIPNLCHIGLTSPALSNVDTLSLSVRNIHPTYMDFYMVLRSFQGLRRVEYLSTQPQDPPVRVMEPNLGSSVLKHARIPLPFTSQYSVFEVRGARILHRIVNIPLLFALEISQLQYQRSDMDASRSRSDSVSGAAAPTHVAHLRLPARMQRLARFYYDPVWALMVRKPLPRWGAVEL